jgi:surface protein
MPSYSGTACIKDKAGNVYVARKYESGEVIKNLRIPVARIIAMELDDIDSECNYVNSFNNLIKAMSNYSGTACIRNEAGKVYAAREYKDGKIKKTFSDIVTREQLKKMMQSGVDVSYVNTSKITDMSEMFKKYNSFNQDISSWDTSNVTNMNSMFYGARSFNQDISNWDTSNVTDMSRMFKYAESFNQDISKWSTINVIDISGMFMNAFSFNQEITNWDVSKVANMSEIFINATLFNQDITSWDTSNATNISRMFEGANAMEIENRPKILVTRESLMKITQKLNIVTT